MRNEELSDILEKSMKAEPEYKLSADFAQKVTLSVVKREQWRTDLSDYLYLTASLIGLLMAVTGIYYIADKELLIRIWIFLKSNLLPVSFILLTVNFIFLADRVLLRLLFNKWKLS
jgi:hypothetical protein